MHYRTGLDGRTYNVINDLHVSRERLNVVFFGKPGTHTWEERVQATEQAIFLTLPAILFSYHSEEGRDGFSQATLCGLYKRRY